MSEVSPSVGHDADLKALHAMGYAQELDRRMSGFSNFAISFSIICILAGGITSFQLAFSAAGGGGVAIGWLVGCLFALVVALPMAQIASAYPTAGGLYHWSSIFGGRGWGWACAWINLLGLVFVTASVDLGVYILARDFMINGVFGIDVSGWTASTTLFPGFDLYWYQIAGFVLIVGSHGVLNHVGIRATTLITDFSGYLILTVATILTLTVLIFSPVSFDFSRLVTFTNFSGDAGGGVWPEQTNVLWLFMLGLLLPIYTITGFDASAHTSEETRSASTSVPRGVWTSVFYSFVFGWVMVCAFVLTMPDPAQGAAQGGNVVLWTIQSSTMPAILRDILLIGIVAANYCCGLACLTSFSRMLFAFARDGGLPKAMAKVSPAYRTPVTAIWVGATLAFLATLYSPAFGVLATGCAVFLYLSYAMPISAALLAHGKTWTSFGPFNLGGLFKPLAVIAVIGAVFLWVIGIQPNNDQLRWYSVGIVVLLLALWFGLESRRFKGPPIGDVIAKRQAEIAAAEKAVGEAA